MTTVGIGILLGLRIPVLGGLLFSALAARIVGPLKKLDEGLRQVAASSLKKFVKFV